MLFYSTNINKSTILIFVILRVWIYLKVSTDGQSVTQSSEAETVFRANTLYGKLHVYSLLSLHPWLLIGLLPELLKMKWTHRPRWKASLTQLPETESQQTCIFEMQTTRRQKTTKLHILYNGGGVTLSFLKHRSNLPPAMFLILQSRLMQQEDEAVMQQWWESVPPHHIQNIHNTCAHTHTNTHWFLEESPAELKTHFKFQFAVPGGSRMFFITANQGLTHIWESTGRRSMSWYDLKKKKKRKINFWKMKATFLFLAH